MSEWKEYKLGDVAEVKYGKAHQALADGCVPAYGSGGLMRYVEKALYNDESILIPRKGTLNNVIFKSEPFWTVDTMFWTKLNKQIIVPKYLFYQLTTVDFANMNVGSAVPSMTVPVLNDIDIVVPPLPEQTAIASVLSSLDDKIDLLHRQNATLEKMAETLFRQWFVEFSENKSEKTYNSELGEIPVSIKIDQIKYLSHILESGKRPKGGVGSLSTGVPSIGAESIKGLGNFDYSKTKFVSEEFAGKMSKGFVNGYELLIYKDGGTPGHFIPRYSIFGAGFPFDKMVINEHVFKLDFGSKPYNFFMYYFFQTEITESILVANGAKAAIPGINQEDIRNLWVITPDNPLIDSFGEITLPYLEKVLSNCKQIRTLTALRDTLLPKLMSGEVRVEI